MINKSEAVTTVNLDTNAFSFRTLSQLQWTLIAFFVLCRLTLLMFYDAYITDVGYYLDIAKQGLTTSAKAYQDFSFGYPPISLFLVYLPAWFAPLEFWSYWRIFRAQMFFIDFSVFFLVFYFLKQKIEFRDEQLSLFVFFYVLLGFLQGHLLYDRLDILIVASLMSLLFAFVQYRENPKIVRVLSLIGMYIKFVPFLFALLLNLITIFDQMKLPSQKTKILFLLGQKGVKELFWLLVPFFLVTTLYETTVARGLFKDMGMHFERGIQVESTWASPIIIKQVFTKNGSPYAVNNFGAQHIDPSQAPEWYVAASKYVGLLSLIVFGLWLFLIAFPRLILRHQLKVSDLFNLGILIWLSLFSLFLSTQRVLSPQFFIWIMLPTALHIAAAPKKLFIFVAITLYILTYIGFDRGYWQFVEGNAFYVSIVALRNLLLILFTGLCIKELKDYCYCGRQYKT